jgi:hypothetical protein
MKRIHWKYIIFSLTLYITLPIVYLLKVIIFLLEIMGFVEECNCEKMEQEKFYFTEKILGASIGMIVLILLVASL